jgi:hypothetical protein
MDLRYFSPIEAFALLPSATDRLADDFRACGATSYERAQPFHPRSVWHESTFQYLVGLDAIREASPGRYYLDEQRLSDVEQYGNHILAVIGWSLLLLVSCAAILSFIL